MVLQVVFLVCPLEPLFSQSLRKAAKTLDIEESVTRNVPQSDHSSIGW